MSHLTLWYVTRASAITAWVFLTLTVVWGALVAGKWVNRKGGRRWLLDLHPYLGSLAVVALGIHIVTAVVNSYVGLTWLNVVLPFSSGWRTIGITAGAIAVWLLAAVEATSFAKRRLRRTTWHRIHLGSYVMAWMTALHAVVVGTDLNNRAVAWGALALVGASTGFALMRALQSSGARRTPNPLPA